MPNTTLAEFKIMYHSLVMLLKNNVGTICRILVERLGFDSRVITLRLELPLTNKSIGGVP